MHPTSNWLLIQISTLATYKQVDAWKKMQLLTSVLAYIMGSWPPLATKIKHDNLVLQINHTSMGLYHR